MLFDNVKSHRDGGVHSRIGYVPEKLSYQLVGSGGAPHLASHNAAEAQCLFSITRFRLDRAWGLFRI